MANTAEPKPLTKTQLFTQIADELGMTRKDVGDFYNSLVAAVEQQINGKKGAGSITLPGLVKIKRIRKPAQAAKKGVPNPFKPGELMDVAAKPARNVIKVQPLKALKEMA